MNDKIVLRPKPLTLLLVVVVTIVGLFFSMYFLSIEKFENGKSYIRVGLPFVFFIIGVTAIKKIKTITILNSNWTIHYLFTRRSISFTKQDVQSSSKDEFVGYKSRIPYEVYSITLRSGKKTQFSTHEIKDAWMCDNEFAKLPK